MTDAPNLRRAGRVQRPVGQDYRKTEGRTRDALRKDVLRVAQTNGVISTFECERDHKLAHAVSTMLRDGDVVRGPEQYPWIGLRLPRPNAQVKGAPRSGVGP